MALQTVSATQKWKKNEDKIKGTILGTKRRNDLCLHSGFVLKLDMPVSEALFAFPGFGAVSLLTRCVRVKVGGGDERAPSPHPF